jgi:hypothetical protein
MGVVKKPNGIYEQLCNEIGASQGISIVLHEDAGGRSNNQHHPPKKQVALKKKKGKKGAHIRCHCLCHQLLDQRRLVHLYP